MQQDVIGDKRGVGAELSAPVAFVAVLHAEDELPRGIDRRSYTTLDVINFAETHFGADLGVLPSFLLIRHGGRGANRLHNLRGQTKAHVLRHHFDLAHIGEPLLLQESYRLLHKDFGRRSSRSKADGGYIL